LAYALGAKIVFAMLLLRGGVLILAPIVDKLYKKRVKCYSWIGLELSMGAVLTNFLQPSGSTSQNQGVTLALGIDVGIYLLAYFIRFNFMSKLAKASDPTVNRRYFVEEQLVASPALLLILGLVALIGGGSVAEDLRFGFTELWNSPILLELILIGLFSQGTGIFGSLIFLDARENTYCIPVNRCSSILAGVLAGFSLALFFDYEPPSVYELAGASLILSAILALTIPPLMAKRRARLALARENVSVRG
jgi:hypothetical protein